MRSIRILEVRIDLLDYGALTQMVDTALRGNIPHLFTAPHFYILLLASRQTWLARLLDRSAINYIDGVGTWFASRVLGARKTPRINGTDFHAQMLALALKEKRKVYFLGGDEATCSALEKRIHSSHPEASVAFQHGHIDTADDRIPEAINAFAPELLFIGLGTPKQFAWLDLHFDTLKVPVVLATGAFLDFAAQDSNGCTACCMTPAACGAATFSASPRFCSCSCANACAELPAHNILSRSLYCIASEICSRSIMLLSPRSAIVRATFRMRS
jgi:N-acetylglucosaminyldiphosphoundecaprenol N-acetyl-beta-D-mannosaminyltransferase